MPAPPEVLPAHRTTKLAVTTLQRLAGARSFATRNTSSMAPPAAELP